jgi:hypothetical protein
MVVVSIDIGAVAICPGGRKALPGRRTREQAAEAVEVCGREIDRFNSRVYGTVIGYQNHPFLQFPTPAPTSLGTTS